MSQGDCKTAMIVEATLPLPLPSSFSAICGSCRFRTASATSTFGWGRLIFDLLTFDLWSITENNLVSRLPIFWCLTFALYFDCLDLWSFSDDSRQVHAGRAPVQSAGLAGTRSAEWTDGEVPAAWCETAIGNLHRTLVRIHCSIGNLHWAPPLVQPYLLNDAWSTPLTTNNGILHRTLPVRIENSECSLCTTRVTQMQVCTIHELKTQWGKYYSLVVVLVVAKLRNNFRKFFGSLIFDLCILSARATRRTQMVIGRWRLEEIRTWLSKVC